MAGEPLVSCLCVTENRPAFLPWLLWNYDRQRWTRRELVVIDSSAPPAELPDRPDVRVILMRYGTSVAAKRNLALENARGDYLTWFDDDDWQHPEKISCLLQSLKGRSAYAGCRQSWFVDVYSRRCSSYRVQGQRMLFNGSIFHTEMARGVRFDERLRKASDTRWMRCLARKCRSSGAVVDSPLFFWLCHERNLSNPAHKRRFGRNLDGLKRSLGRVAWGDTAAALDALGERLAAERNEAATVAVKPSARSGRSRRETEPTATRPPARRTRAAKQSAPREVMDVPVTAMIKATTLDAGYLGEIVPHMLRQARYPFAERIVVVDPKREFEGKYRRRDDFSRRQLDEVLAGLLERDEIDRMEEVSYEPREVDAINRRYFRRTGVPTHATSGGPIYPTLWGMERARTDHVVQFDADMLFYTDGESWVGRALACMEADRSLWAMMTHPGPPVGPPGWSLRGPNRRRARWDADLQLWRFRSVSTRFFLTDRRRLWGELRVHGPRGSCLPLEQCIGRTLVRNRAYRGDLGTCRSWHVHAFSHAAPFPEWAPKLIEAIEAGRYPERQAGCYDMRLDRSAERSAWREILMPRAAASTKRAKLRRRASRRESRTASDTSAISAVIPVRDRPAARVHASLASLAWQTKAPLEVRVVSQGSSAEINTELTELCERFGASFDAIDRPLDPWCKPRALNHGIRQTSERACFVMTLDADMILAPNFLEVVAVRLEGAAPPGAMVLCRSRDLPRSARVPADEAALAKQFGRLRRLGRLRGPQGCGGIQAAPRSFFFDVRGYDEDFIWWGEEDRDMVARAELYGLKLSWIERSTAMLHQWHPHATTSGEAGRRRAHSEALAQNRAMRQARASSAVRNNPGWIEQPASS